MTDHPGHGSITPTIPSIRRCRTSPATPRPMPTMDPCVIARGRAAGNGNLPHSGADFPRSPRSCPPAAVIWRLCRSDCFRDPGPGTPKSRKKAKIYCVCDPLTLPRKVGSGALARCPRSGVSRSSTIWRCARFRYGTILRQPPEQSPPPHCSFIAIKAQETACLFANALPM